MSTGNQGDKAMAKRWALIDVEKIGETEKAIQCEYSVGLTVDRFWLPKSQVVMAKPFGEQFHSHMCIPGWLLKNLPYRPRNAAAAVEV